MRRALPVLLLLASQGAQAADFRSVQESTALLYDAPSRAAKPLYVVSRHYPLEVISTSGAWLKVRDHAGALTWIETKAVGDKRMVLVTEPLVDVRARPEDSAPAAFSVAQNVALELVEGVAGAAAGGWLRVRHADGATGYLRAAQVWGE